MEPPSSPVVSVLNHTGLEIDTAPIERAVRSALLHKSIAEAEACVLLTSDEEIQRLNREFRHLDEPTDVLTFPTEEPGGDIAIAVPYAQRQAERRRVSLEQELAYLAIHGGLHLSGMDDETDSERDEMLHQMNAVARSLSLPEDHEWGSLLHGEKDSA
jgi:rRNA maturation RNase YbeY